MAESAPLSEPLAMRLPNREAPLQNLTPDTQVPTADSQVPSEKEAGNMLKHEYDAKDDHIAHVDEQLASITIARPVESDDQPVASFTITPEANSETFEDATKNVEPVIKLADVQLQQEVVEAESPFITQAERSAEVLPTTSESTSPQATEHDRVLEQIQARLQVIAKERSEIAKSRQELEVREKGLEEEEVGLKEIEGLSPKAIKALDNFRKAA